MPSPMEMGFRQPRSEKPADWKSKEYNQKTFGHEAEKIFTEALSKHPYIKEVKRDDYSDEREKTDFFVTFKGSSKPIRVQFSLKKKTGLPSDVVFVKGENRIFDDAKKRYETRKEENPNITPADCIAKQDLNELIGRILDKLPTNRRKNILARLSASTHE